MSEESIKVQMKKIINGANVNVSPMVDISCVNGLSDDLYALSGKLKEITQKIEKDKRIQKKKNWIARSRKRGK